MQAHWQGALQAHWQGALHEEVTCNEFSSTPPIKSHRISVLEILCPYLRIASAIAKVRPHGIRSGLRRYRRLCETQYRSTHKGKAYDERDRDGTVQL